MAYGNIGVFSLRTPATNGYAVGLRFTTNGSGVPTLEDDYDGKFTIVQATNTYTITGPEVGAYKAIVASHSLFATVNAVVTHTTTTIVIAMSTDFDSATCDVVAFASDSLNG